ncbi:MAG: CHAD domain-containing protein [Myxococcaceae bacterium]
MDLPPPAEISDLPSREGARSVALAILDDASRHAASLAQARDEETLHDFRVAVRKLRAWLRAFHGELEDTVGRRALKRLRAVQQLSGGARDAEVQAIWLRGHLKELPPDAVPAAEMLAQALDAEANAGFDVEGTLERFARVEQLLRDGLSRWTMELKVGEQGEVKPFAWAWMTALRQALADLHDSAGKVQGAHDNEALHETRIRVKRLRYLTEPLKSWPEGKELLSALKKRQELLGELHDRHVLLLRCGTLTAEGHTGAAEGISALLRAQVAQLYALHLELRTGDGVLGDKIELICARLHQRRALRVDYFPLD